jgi:predicted AlkP superfamily pyrophosphatase or phosphodiesterase
MPTPRAAHAVIFVVDGLRPDALPQVATPCIDRLAAEGAYTWQAQSVSPSITLPCHASLFLAVPPSCHGIVSNVWTVPQPPVPSLIETVHRAGGGTAAFYSWEQLRDLASPGALDFAYHHRLGDPEEGVRELEIAGVAADYIVRHRPALAFVYIEAPDMVGHRHGWMSAPYLRAVGVADRAIGLVLDAMAASGQVADTVCVVLADHGGHGLNHGDGVPEDLTIPWVIAGAGIRSGQPITGPVSIIDTAPMLAHLLGLAAPAEWQGQVVEEALEA